MFCPHCGKEVADNQVYCQYCGVLLAEPAVRVSGERSRTAWEDRESLGFLTGLLRTLRETVFSPSQFFKKMSVTGGLTDPLLYAMIVGMAGLTFFYFWDVLLHNPLRSYMTPELRAAADRNLISTIGTVVVAVLTPFVLIFWLFLVSGMLHIFLLVVRGGRAGFEATFRVVSYSISPFVFLIIPVCGMPITSLWIMTLAIIGLKQTHEISGGKAAFAVLFPFIFCCGLLILAIVVFMSAVAASFGWVMNMSH
jgi:hypothetical protein